MRKRNVVVMFLGCIAFVSSPAHAALCPSPVQAVSCHNIEPTAELASLDNDVVVPLGQYAPFIWHASQRRIEPPAYVNSKVTAPGLDIRLGAGGWGEDGAEPMAIARMTLSYPVDAPRVQWLGPPPPLGFNCELGTPLCYQYGSSGQYRTVWTRASSSIYRRYRVQQVVPGTLPVGFIPILVDYRMVMYVSGTTKGLEGTVEGLSGQTIVQFGWFVANNAKTAYSFRSIAGHECGSGNGLRCAPPGEVVKVISGRVHSGTLVANMALATLDTMALRVYASLAPSRPYCSDREVDGRMQCVIEPYLTNGHAVADPYVYIDPSWPYASWFKLQVSADETDTEWITPQRTTIDPETLTVINGGVDAGAAQDAAAGDGRDAGGGGNRDGATGNGGGVLDAGLADAGTSGSGDSSGCSCNVAGHPRSTSGVPLLAMSALALLCVRRARKLRGSQSPA